MTLTLFEKYNLKVTNSTLLGVFESAITERDTLITVTEIKNLRFYSHAPKDNIAELKALFDGTSELEDRRFGSRLPDDNIEDLKTLFDGESSQVTPKSGRF